MKKVVIASMIGLFLGGCGGGESSDSAPAKANPSTVLGTIEAISGDTVTVNGHHYTVSKATYASQAVPLSELRPNMLVEVRTGTSTRRSTAANNVQLQLEPTITGFISDIDRGAGSFTVNGITLSFTQLSSEISNGDWVMVSSLPTANAGYHVLSVVKFDDADLVGIVEVEGVINNLTDTNFDLGAALNIDYSNAFVEDNAQLQNGLWVEVSGSLNGASFTATKVEVEDLEGIDDDAEIEGLVTWVANSSNSFELNYRGHIEITSQTRFEDGSKAALKPGVRVEVSTSKNGPRIVATEVEFDDEIGNGDWGDSESDLEGVVQSTNQLDHSFVIRTVNAEHTIFVNNNTRYDDGLSFATLPARRVEAEVTQVNGQYIAQEIEAEDD